MRDNEVITFNGKDLSDYGVYYDGSRSFTKPQKQIDLFQIPGRSGDLTITQGRFSNVNISYDCYIVRNFKDNYLNLINDLSVLEGYGRLETTEEPDIYREAVFMDEMEATPGQFNKNGTFTLSFNCKPQKWLKSGEKGIAVTSSSTLLNPCQFDSKPLIAVSGTGSITINSSVLTLANNTSTTYIDCDIQDAYEGTINRNGDLTVTNGFPVLKPGANTVSVSGCTIVITPRWWRL